MDTLSKEERSVRMSLIKSKNTKPEIWFRKQLFHMGYRYSLHPKRVLGKPDMWLRKYNTAIFVHGCFWHHHENCKIGRIPKSKVDFWTEKFERNKQRDKATVEALRKKGIKVVIVWECTVQKMKKDKVFNEQTLKLIENFLGNAETYLEL